jgi:hypothetical protein
MKIYNNNGIKIINKWSDYLMIQPVWIPSREQVVQSKLYRWMRKHRFDDLEAFYRRSVQDVAWFWDEVVKEKSTSLRVV